MQIIHVLPRALTMEGRTQFGNDSANWPSGPETAAAAAIRCAICAAKSSQAMPIVP